jgi:hypothetical protein
MAMNGHFRERSFPRRRAQELEHTRQEHNQRLAWHLEDILRGRGLTQPSYSVAGGRGLHVPHVISVVDGPPVGLEIQMLPGQAPHDFAAHAPAIAYNLGVAAVQVVSIGPSMIRLELLRGPGHEAAV